MSAKRDSKQMGAVKPVASSGPAPSRDSISVSGDYSSDALFAARPSKKPTSPSIGAMKRVMVSAPVPPPPPVMPPVDPMLNDDFGFDLDFSRPIEQSIPPAEPAFQDGPSVETTLVFEDSAPSHLQPINASAASNVLPDDAFDFGDATEVWSGALPDFDQPSAQPATAKVSEPALEMELPLMQSVPVPSLPVSPSAAPKFDVAARRAERAERVRSLIRAKEFTDALDLIELLRAGADDALVAELERECRVAQSPVAPRTINMPSVPIVPPKPPVASTAVVQPTRAMPVASSPVAPAAPSAPVLRSKPDIEPIDELGGMGSVLSMVANSAAIRTLNLDHRAGFLLSLIDGFSTVEDVLDLANMPSDECLALLVDLKRRGLLR